MTQILKSNMAFYINDVLANKIDVFARSEIEVRPINRTSSRNHEKSKRWCNRRCKI